MRSLLLLSAGALAVVASPAAARNGAWYVGGDFGAAIVEDTPINFGPGVDVKISHNVGFDGDLFVGYDLGAFRLEAEGSYKRASLDKFENSFLISTPGTTIPIGEHKVDGDASALSFMVNGMLDFGDEDGISGFVGGGSASRGSTTTTFEPSRIRILTSTTATPTSPGKSSLGYARRSVTGWM
jgi:opacity protein-like surface antigen